MIPRFVLLGCLLSVWTPAQAGGLDWGDCCGSDTGTSDLPAPAVEALRSFRADFRAPTRLAIDEHDQVFVVEQNRDAQMRTLLINEIEIDPAKLIRVLHFDGTPITARYIAGAITRYVHALAVAPRREKIA